MRGKNGRYLKVALAMLGVFAFAIPAMADWDPDIDDYKMHYPQLPNPEGWDVCLVCQWLADDFKCTETGPITDIHFWTSWRHDEIGEVAPDQWEIFLYDDAGGVPGNQLWRLNGGNFVTRWYGQGEQGWMCPSPPSLAVRPDHNQFFQVNITDIQDPFVQEEGTIYWLVIRALIPEYPNPVVGWKTTFDIFNSPAKWSQDLTMWSDINADDQVHDLAFVITGGWEEDQGACCYGEAAPLCVVTDQITCERTYFGIWMGPGTDCSDLDGNGIADICEGGHEESDFGDAPEEALAYSTGTVGMFPTCMNVGAPGSYIQHGLGWAHFGPGWDPEPDGNGGLCPMFAPYDNDECFQDGDAGLLIPESFTIQAGVEVPCPGVGGIPLGFVCQPGVWGGNIDIEVFNNMPVRGYVNVLFDWNQDGVWSGGSTCPTGYTPEHALVNFVIPSGFAGPLSALVPPNFLIGPNPGFVWTRFTITERPVDADLWDGSGVFEDGETEDYLLLIETEEEPKYDYGDAPEEALAYSTGIIGQFPTCMTVGAAGSYIQHYDGSVFFGPSWDPEWDGNGGLCPTFAPYDNDECFQDGDAGLRYPEPFTIQGGVEVPCPNSNGTPLGIVCQLGIWGGNIDINVTNNASLDCFINVLADWDQNGVWSGASQCPNGTTQEHILVDLPIPSGYSGPLSGLLPPNFIIGPNAGYVWFRFTVSEMQVGADGWFGEGIFEFGETEDYLLLIEPEEEPRADFGDAPEEALAYSTGVAGQFPTCIGVGSANSYIMHYDGSARFGDGWDPELDGNGGLCPTFAPYDNDECFQDGDAGLRYPESFTIQGGVEVPCPNSNGTPLGIVCQQGVWGGNIDIDVVNNAGDCYVNVLADWNQDGAWFGSSICPNGTVPEQVLVDFPVPGGYSGPLSGLNPPNFLIGPNAGFVWFRFTISESPVGADGWPGDGIYEIGETEDYLLLIEPEEEPRFDFGDAPENAVAYASGLTGQFPTCINVGPAGSYIQHGYGSVFFGPSWDPELDGNGGLCPFFAPYNNDECFQDGDAGLIMPEPFTIQAGVEVPCPNSNGTVLGLACQQAVWGTNVDIQVTNGMAADVVVNVLIDWNQDGAWGGSSPCPLAAAPEHVLVNFPVPAGYTGPLSALAPPAFVVGPYSGYVWARFTVSPTLVVPGQWDGSGVFEDGESEDYLLLIEGEPEPQYEYGDAPEEVLAYSSGVVGQFPTCINVGLAGSYIEHRSGNAFFGQSWDPEWDGNGGLCPLFAPYDNDECFLDGDAGLIIPEPFTIQGGVEVPCPNSTGTLLGFVCQPAVWGTNVDIQVTNTRSSRVFVSVLVDWNQNGVWAGGSACPNGTAPELVLANFPIPAGYAGPLSGLNPPNFLIGPNAGFVWARFTITDATIGLDDWDGSGVFEDGETEDYLLLVEEEEVPTDDFGDCPDSYLTLLASGGPHHTVLANVFLGALIDAEWDGFPHPAALGDDNNNLDDEDGITNMSPFIVGQPATFDVTASVNGVLDVWFDFNGDGSFAQPGDQIFGATGVPIPAGLSTVTFMVPATATPNIATFARFRFSTAGGLSYGGAAPDGEVEDYQVFLRELPQELHPKWSQYPSDGGDGFDAPSNLWWPEEASGEIVKWEQLPTPETAGIHAHDYDLGDGYQRIILADDWLCEGGVVTDFHWWGTVEDYGAGAMGFHLSIHDSDPQCLPIEPPLWVKDIPMSDITVTPTGIFNSVGLEIMRYDYYLPQEDWFYQEQGREYWFDVSAMSIDPMEPFVWIWAEHYRGPRSGIKLCPASEWLEPTAPFWQWIFWPTMEWYSDMAFRVTSHEEVEPRPNKVVADDWICDGRPVEAVRWWGSYWDPMFQPEEPVEPYIVDGWIISFHHDVERECPPDFAAGDDPTVLGLYWAPRDAVEIYALDMQDCFNHNVYEYVVRLRDCCLICSEADPRDGDIPAWPEMFNEVQSYRYWLDIQAVVGVEWIEEEPGYCHMQYTGHLPSPDVEDGDFWGWHTSYGPEEPCLSGTHEACRGRAVNFDKYPPECWDYADWEKQPWLCPSAERPVHMAFELLTSEPDPCPTCQGDMNGDGLVNGLDIQCFINCLISGPTAGCNCACGDFNCTKSVEMGDVSGFVDRLINYTPPC